MKACLMADNDDDSISGELDHTNTYTRNEETRQRILQLGFITRLRVTKCDSPGVGAGAGAEEGPEPASANSGQQI